MCCMQIFKRVEGETYSVCYFEVSLLAVNSHTPPNAVECVSL